MTNARAMGNATDASATSNNPDIVGPLTWPLPTLDRMSGLEHPPLPPVNREPTRNVSDETCERVCRRTADGKGFKSPEPRPLAGHVPTINVRGRSGAADPYPLR
jgi:hypothetical protein